MNTLIRLAFAALCLLLVREGIRLSLSSVWLLDQGSPFQRPVGLLAGLTACGIGALSAAEAFVPGYLSRKGMVASSAWALGGLAVTAHLHAGCDSLTSGQHVLEALSCQRLPRIAAGLLLYPMLAAASRYLAMRSSV